MRITIELSAIPGDIDPSKKPRYYRAIRAILEAAGQAIGDLDGIEIAEHRSQVDDIIATATWAAEERGDGPPGRLYERHAFDVEVELHQPPAR
jgi:hypothetical protein